MQLKAKVIRLGEKRWIYVLCNSSTGNKMVKSFYEFTYSHNCVRSLSRFLRDLGIFIEDIDVENIEDEYYYDSNL